MIFSHHVNRSDSKRLLCNERSQGTTCVKRGEKLCIRAIISCRNNEAHTTTTMRELTLSIHPAKNRVPTETLTHRKRRDLPVVGDIKCQLYSNMDERRNSAEQQRGFLKVKKVLLSLSKYFVLVDFNNNCQHIQRHVNYIMYVK